MSRTGNRLRKAAKKVATKAESTVKHATDKARKAIRNEGKNGARRRIGDAVVAAGGAALAGLAVEHVGRALRSRRSSAAPAGFEVDLPVGFETAIERVTSALKAEGFGILTRIDVHTTLRDRLGLSFRPYAILGACNPTLAHRALIVRAEAGLLLPCNVTVEEGPEHTSVVRIADPQVMLQALGEDTALRETAREARDRLQRVVRSLREHAAAVVL
jgi:uncharacterized protein (DUF302 family)